MTQNFREKRHESTQNEHLQFTVSEEKLLRIMPAGLSPSPSWTVLSPSSTSVPTHAQTSVFAPHLRYRQFAHQEKLYSVTT